MLGFVGALCSDISRSIQTGAESWGRFPVPRICRWESREVNEAKVLLWQVAGDRLPGIVVRQDSELRSAKEEDITDILNAFRKMDCDEFEFPRFVL